MRLGQNIPEKTIRCSFSFLAINSINYLKDNNPYKKKDDVMTYQRVSESLEILRTNQNPATIAIPYETLEIHRSLEEINEEKDKRARRLDELVKTIEYKKNELFGNSEDVQSYLQKQSEINKKASIIRNTALIGLAGLTGLYYYNERKNKKARNRELVALKAE